METLYSYNTIFILPDQRARNTNFVRITYDKLFS
jgi:hypothetical protein